MEKIHKTDAEWKALLTPEQYQVTRHGGTECAFTGALWNDHSNGVFHCVCCDLPLFDSNRSEEHTSELQSLMRISYAVFCLKTTIKRTLYTQSHHMLMRP